MPFRFDGEGGGQLVLQLEPDTVASLQELAGRLRDAEPVRRSSPSGEPESDLDEVALACMGTTLYLAEQTNRGVKVILRTRTGRSRRLLFAWDRADVETVEPTAEGRLRTAWRRRSGPR